MNLIKWFLMLVLSSVNSFHIGIIEHLPTIKDLSHTLPYETRTKIVQETTGILPKLDFFSHAVLSNNEKFIDYIVYSPLPRNKKKLLY